MIKDKVLEILYRLGFRPELIDESIGYRFEYEGLTILYSPDEEDAQTVTLVIPSVFDVTDDNRVAALEAVAALSSKMKFVQPNIALDSVWLNYQHFLGEHEPTQELIEHMVRVLAVSTVNFHKIINKEGYDE